MWTDALKGLWQAIFDPSRFFATAPPDSYCLVPLALTLLVDELLVELRSPFVLKAAVSTLPTGVAIPHDAVEGAYARFAGWSMAGVPVRILVFVVLTAILLSATLGALGHLSRFSRLFSIVSFGGVTLLLGRCFSVALLYILGLNHVEQAADVTPLVGLGFLVPDASPLLRELLETVNVFEIWFVAVLAAGVRASERVPVRVAIGAVLGTWLIMQGFRLGLSWLLFQDLGLTG